ncbi:MAG: serine/threonine protein kinase, partial [Planctomycetota bacterium]
HASKKKEIAKPRFINMFSQICNALRTAHTNAVLHRRLNPVNILVGETGEVYVDGWDFGKIIGEPDLAKRSFRRLIEENAADGRVLTGEKKRAVLSCLPPELIEGKFQDVNETSDVYSLGAVLFFLLTGNEPVGGVSPTDIFTNILQGKLVLKSREMGKSGMAPEFLALCRKAMAFEKKDRYGGVGALLEALYKIR